MPAATNRAELIAVTEKEFSKLTELLATVDADFAIHKCEEDTSIKDVIGHRAHWTNMFFHWYQQGQDSGKADIPVKGYKWSQLKEYNARIRDDQANLSWESVRVMLENSHAQLAEFIETKSNDDLYNAPMKGGNGKWSTGRFAEAAGASHYRSASKYVRMCLRECQNLADDLPKQPFTIV